MVAFLCSMQFQPRLLPVFMSNLTMLYVLFSH
jgi:hypothetical protein